MNVIIFRRTLQLVQHARTRLELDIEESSAPYWLCIHEKHSNSRSLAGKADLIFMGIIHHDNKSDQLKYSKLKKKNIFLSSLTSLLVLSKWSIDNVNLPTQRNPYISLYACLQLLCLARCQENGKQKQSTMVMVYGSS